MFILVPHNPTGFQHRLPCKNLSSHMISKVPTQISTSDHWKDIDRNFNDFQFVEDHWTKPVWEGYLKLYYLVWI